MNKQEIEIAIEIIASDKKAFESVNHGGFTNKIKAFELAISVLEQQLTNGWISVYEQLPEINTEVLATYSSGDMSVDFIQNDGDWFWEDREEGLEVIAWRPLPEPYTE